MEEDIIDFKERLWLEINASGKDDEYWFKYLHFLRESIDEIERDLLKNNNKRNGEKI